MLPTLNPIPRNLDWEVPVINPVGKNFDMVLPIINTSFNEVDVDITIPNVKTNVCEVMNNIANVSTNIQEVEANITIPNVKTNIQEVVFEILVPKYVPKEILIPIDNQGTNKEPENSEQTKRNITVNDIIQSNNGRKYPDSILINSEDDDDPDPSNPQEDIEEDSDSDPRPEHLLHDLQNVKNFDDLGSVYYKWEDLLVNPLIWGVNINPIDNPIMCTVMLTGIWPGLGIFICPECMNFSANCFTKLRNHMITTHGILLKGNILHALIGKIANELPYWIIQREDTITKSASYNIYNCPEPECEFFTTTKENLHFHIDKHKELKNRIKNLGMFWGTIVHWAAHNKLVKPSDIMKKLKGHACPECKDFLSGALFGFSHHIVQHENYRKEGIKRPCAIKAKLTPMLINEDDEENYELISELLHPSNNNSDVPKDDEKIVEISENNYESTHTTSENEDNLIINDEISDNAYRTQISDNVDKDELANKAIKWLRKCEQEDENIISFPRLTEKLRKIIYKPIKNLFEDKINKLLDKFILEPIDERDWIINQGILSKINLLIRRTIRFFKNPI
ncbi:hypothetical protein GPJ56_000962 [Histomonas meleagridis]|uniref:uncharacterized protein n=1 Tax=Histomonas meleagridis TaxID=135588 RepID=UPI00355AAF57|nr:hypothetical protein GPJ56_000962 [Histomonas meleagridis]KAH0803797.1 hypothetical protein GO595_002627 [Histomonas meleagridis]